MGEAPRGAPLEVHGSTPDYEQPVFVPQSRHV